MYAAAIMDVTSNLTVIGWDNKSQRDYELLFTVMIIKLILNFNLINTGMSSSSPTPTPPFQYVAVLDTQMFLLSCAQYNVLNVVPDTDRSYQYRVG